MKKKIISLIAIMLIMMMSIFPTYAAVPAEGGAGTGQPQSGTLDSAMKGAEGFLSEGTATVNEPELKKTSDLLFNVLLGIGMVTAVIVGMIIGIKFMMSTIEEKAKIKEQLIPYIAGCVVIFGAFGIWKLAITILATW